MVTKVTTTTQIVRTWRWKGGSYAFEQGGNALGGIAHLKSRENEQNVHQRDSSVSTFESTPSSNLPAKSGCKCAGKWRVVGVEGVGRSRARSSAESGCENSPLRATGRSARETRLSTPAAPSEPPPGPKGNSPTARRTRERTARSRHGNMAHRQRPGAPAWRVRAPILPVFWFCIKPGPEFREFLGRRFGSAAVSLLRNLGSHH